MFEYRRSTGANGYWKIDRNAHKLYSTTCLFALGSKDSESKIQTILWSNIRDLTCSELPFAKDPKNLIHYMKLFKK